VIALVAFDLGGTTVHDRGEVPAAFTAAVRDAGLSIDPADLHALRGSSKYDALRRLLGPAAPPSRLDEVYGRFQGDLIARLAVSHPLSIAGVRESFTRLRGADIRVAVTSGFDRKIVDVVMKAVDWADLIDVCVCSDDVPQGRPAPYMIFRAMEQTGVLDVRDVAVVGDTVRDMEAGWNAGVAYRVAVLTGAHDRDTLRAAPHTHIVDSVADVPSIWLGGRTM
jgi:phosphonatase-like hydrolase